MAGSSPDPTNLLDLPLFAGLATAEIARVHAHLSTESHLAGTYVFRRGEPGESLYVVLAGQVVMELDGDGKREIVAVCGPGNWFGEIALLTGRPRSADARVTVDATLLRVTRSAWMQLSLASPHLFARLCERLSRQLLATTEPRSPSRRAVIACEWATDLGRSIRRQFPSREVHVLADDGSALTLAAHGQPGGRSDRAALERALADIVTPGALVLVSARGIEVLCDGSTERIDATTWTIAPGRCGRHVEVIHGATRSAAVDRVARHLAGGTVGLALGAGGAYGLAHLGLLQTLEAGGVPVDYVAGTSIGAIVGAALAAGTPVERMIAFAEGVADRYGRIVLGDLDIRGPALLTGAGVMRVLAEIDEIHDARFEDLLLPFAGVAMDLATGDEVILDRGRVLDGIRPSFAMPGIFPACPVDGRLLVDGAMVNPVPVDRVRALGADFVLASQPIPSLQPAPEDPVGSLVERVRRIVDFLPVWRLRTGFDALGTSLRAFQALWYRLANAAALTADVTVAPDLRRFWFLQFGEASRIIDTGRQTAAVLLPEIKTALRGRVGLEVGAHR